MIPSNITHFLDDIPVDLEAVAAEMGLAIYSDADLPKGVSGMLKRDPSFGTPSGFVVLVNGKEPAKRQRFTAAHEIGHYVLHKESVGEGTTDNYLLRSPGMSNKQEVEANKFAAALLMPYTKINEVFDEGTITLKDMADKFGVSEIAMGIRLGVPA